MVDAEDESVKVELPLPGAGMPCGTKVPVTPTGRPLTERLTAALKPPIAVVVTLTLAEAPTMNEIDDGPTATARSGLDAVPPKPLASAWTSTEPSPVTRS